MRKRTIVYIAGYGRSGSTLLERILGSHEKINGVGEISILLDLIGNKKFLCSCGNSLYECCFWSETMKELESAYPNIDLEKKLQLKFETCTAIGKYFFRHHSVEKRKYKDLMHKIFESVFQASSSRVRYIIDSSKTSHRCFFRPIALSKIASLDIKMIHLVRDGRGCIASLLKGSNRKIEKSQNPIVFFASLRAAIGWLFANTAAHLFQILHDPTNYCRIRFEDLSNDYPSVMKKLSEFLDANFEKQVEMLKNNKTFPQLHQVGGNRLRFQKDIILKKPSQNNRLKLKDKIFFWVFDWPLSLLYGYK